MKTNCRLSSAPLQSSPLFCVYMGALKVATAAGPNNAGSQTPDDSLKSAADFSPYMSPTDPLPASAPQAPQRIRRDSRLDVDLYVPHVYTDELVQIDGDYEYRNEESARLGEGAFGIVFRGRQRRTGRAVAVKKLPTASIKPSELAVMQSLNSPYLVALLDICPTPAMNCTYFVMELCDTDLDHHLTHCAVDRKLSGKNLRTIIENIARGYDVLYDERIVHRDIKPQNILVQYKDSDSVEIRTAKIADFGISRVLEPGADDDQGCAYEYLSNVAGTLSYMAPEVGANLLKTCQYDFQVDMWSIGCVLYQCITGQLPFDERSLCRLFLSAAGGNYDAYDKPELSSSTPEVEAIVSALLEIDTRKRLTPHEFYEMAIELSSSQTLVAEQSN
uniref:Protein kinase domain-containing protein n=1 Tax=Plectus sambesii TaxID=2011161 RepID=A0A914VJG6_9BILA